MAGIERASSQIGVQTGLQTSRPFRTDLPDPGVGIQQGVNALSGALGQTAKELMANEADTAAKDAGNAAIISKNPETGMYEIPKAPSTFGWVAQKQFDQMVEEKTANQTFYDTSLELNRIAADNYSNPEKAMKLMKVFTDAQSQAMDPRIAGRLQNQFSREIQQRHFAITQRAAANQEAVLVDTAAQTADGALRNTSAAMAAGDVTAVADYLKTFNAANETMATLNRSSVANAAIRWKNTIEKADRDAAKISLDETQTIQLNETDTKLKTIMASALEAQGKNDTDAVAKLRQEWNTVYETKIGLKRGSAASGEASWQFGINAQNIENRARKLTADEKVQEVEASLNIQNAISAISDARAAGDKPEEAKQLGIWRDQNQRLVALGKSSPALIAAQETQLKSTVGASEIIRVIKERFDKSALSPADFEMYGRLVSNQLGNNEVVYGGYDSKWVRENIPDPRVRQSTLAYIKQFQQSTAEKWGKTIEDQTYDNLAKDFDGEYPKVGKPVGVSEAAMATHELEWARRNDYDVSTTKGVQAILTRFGHVPEKIVKETFQGIMNNPQALERALPLYTALTMGTKDRNGQLLPSQTDLLDKRDEAFMYLYKNTPITDPATRYDNAVKAFNRMPQPERGTQFKVLKEAAGGNVDQDKIESMLVDGLPHSGILQQKLSMLPAPAQELLVARAAIFVAAGQPLAQAITASQRAFTSAWAPDSSTGALLKGMQNRENGSLAWVQKKDMIPDVTHVGSTTRDGTWVIPYLRAAVGHPQERTSGAPIVLDSALGENPQIPDVPAVKGVPPNDQKTPFRAVTVDQQTGNFTELPRDWVLGKDFWVDPVGNGAYAMFYKKAGTDVPMMVLDASNPKNPKPIYVYPAQAAKAQEDFAKAENVARTGMNFSIREASPAPAIGPAIGPNGELSVQSLPDPAGTVYRPELPFAETGRVRAPVNLRDFLNKNDMPPSDIRTGPVPPTTTPAGTQPAQRSTEPRAPNVTFAPGYEPTPKPEKTSFTMPQPTEGRLDVSRAAVTHFTSKTWDDSATEWGYTWADFKNSGVKGGEGIIDSRTVTALDQLSTELGRKITITSANRDPAYNAKVGGAAGSRHIHGDAMDIDVSDPAEQKQAIKYLASIGVKGVGVYDGWIHMDLGRSRTWSERNDISKSDVDGLMAEGRRGLQQTTAATSGIQGINDTIGSNVAIATDYFQRRGYSNIAAAGIVGNLIGESGVDPNIRSSKDITASLGVAQWLGPRLSELQTFASKHGLDMRNLGTQLSFVEHELSTTEYRVREKLMNAKNVEGATSAFLGFERPKYYDPTQPEHHPSWGSRITGARSVLKMLGGQNV